MTSGNTIRVHELDGLDGAVGLVCGGMSRGNGAVAVEVEVERLIEVLATIDAGADVVVFLTDEARDDPATVARVIGLVGALRAAPDRPAAATRRVPAVHAVKRVRDGVVVESVDRSTLNLLRSPEVIDRRALEEALGQLGSGAEPVPDANVINPTELVAAAGGEVLVVETD